MATFNSTDRTNPAFYRPSETALLLLDFHTKFTQLPGGSDATKVAADLRRWAQSQGMFIVHGLLDTSRTPYETCKDADRLGGIAKAMKVEDAIEPQELQADSSDAAEVTFLRTLGYVSALKSSGILEWLHSRNIKSLILAGLSTGGCVLRMAIPATDEEFVVTVISDACADPKEGVHDLLCTKILTNRAYVSTYEEFRNGYSAARNGQ